MRADEIKIQSLVEGVKQFVLPLFQRKYVWDRREWEILWIDILSLLNEENHSYSHFIGSIVTMPMNSVPHGVAKHVLIDGQQRLTTIFILFTLLRDKAKELSSENNLSDQINETILINKYSPSLDYYKLLPTEKDSDRDSYIKITKNDEYIKENQITKAYEYFKKKIDLNSINIRKLFEVITQKISLVSISLHEYDNPYLVFESLNSKGSKLLPSDLIRNYFFMKINTTDQTEIYKTYWSPMEEKFDSEKHTEFIRHFLMKDGVFIKENDVYFTLKEIVDKLNPVDYLKELLKYSDYYEKLLNPLKEEDKTIKKYLERINVLEVTTSYPFLLNCYHDYKNNKISKIDFIEILKIIENYLIRRYICNMATNQLNKVFPVLYKQITELNCNNFIEGLKKVLQTKGYPKDIEFERGFKEAKLYGAGNKIAKTKLILSSIEESYGHRELIDLSTTTIEHILPQTIKNSEWWKNHLGEEWEMVHELNLNILGNLTLTAYNSQLSNDAFTTKVEIYKNSHLEINKYFNNINSWKEEDISNRTNYLSEICLKIWSYFGESNILSENVSAVTKPNKLIILGQEFQVKHWADVLEKTISLIIEVDEEKTEGLCNNFPRFISKEKEKFRRPSEIKSGIFVEKNLNSEQIKKLCIQSIEYVGLSSEDWIVELTGE